MNKSMPCSQCGDPVKFKNLIAAKWASIKGIICPDCLNGTHTWNKAKYAKYLESDHWQSFRKAALNYYGRKCYLCGTTKGQIDIHHNTYDRLWNEKMSDVIPLCHPHHEMYEENK